MAANGVFEPLPSEHASGQPVGSTRATGHSCWYRTGLKTSELCTRPRQFELYAQGFVLDHARWEGEPGEAICVQFPEAALRALLRDDARAESFTNLHEMYDERHGVGPRPPPRRFRRLERGRASRVLDYIEAHLGEDLSVAALAEVAGLSTAHFSRLFRATFGRSPHGFVLEQRVRAADEMLLRGQQTIAQVAYCLGFSSQSHFTQAFRQLTGRTPGRARTRGPSGRTT